MKRFALTATALLFACAQLHAATIPSMINYTGTVEVNGSPFNGDGHFRFAIINGHTDCQADTPTTNCVAYWSHNSTSQNGGMPDTALTLTVTNGLFSIKLGDAARMTPLPGTVFDNPQTYLRVWFAEGTNGPQRLTPDRQLIAVPYAYRAEVAEKLSGAGSITQELLAPASVTTTTIVNQAVTSDKIADGTITGADINPTTALNVGGLQVGKSLLVQSDQGGSLELGGANSIANAEIGGVPYLDFHYGTGTAQDYNARIINDADNQLSFVTKSGGAVMTVNGGNVGIGTSAPERPLHIKASGAGADFASNARILIENGAGNRFFLNTWESDRFSIGKAGATATTPGADILTIDGATGNVGIGTTAPAGKLDVAGDIRAGNSDIYFTKTDHIVTGLGNTTGYAAIENDSGVYNTLMILGRSTAGGRQVGIWDDLKVDRNISYGGSLTATSDARLKENILPLDDALNKVMGINGVRYNFKGSDRAELGVIAQNVQAVLPELVSIVDPQQGYLGVNYVGLIPVLIEALKEQQQQILQLNTDLARLKAQLGQP